MIQNSFVLYRRHGILFLIFFAALFEPLHLQAQVTLGARAVALGQATTALPGNEWAVFENTAMISENRRQVSFFAMRYHGFAELTDLAAIVTIPTSFGLIGGGAHRYGDDLFNENRVRLVYKNSFRHFHYGVALNYNYVVQGDGYGSFGALGVDVGLAALVTDGLWLGAKATNINQPEYGKINTIVEEVPRNLSIGLSYRPSDLALFTADVLKDVDFSFAFRGGVEVKVISNLKARAGITTEPQTFAGGFGYNTRTWGVNVVAQRHEERALGYSPGVDFNIAW